MFEYRIVRTLLVEKIPSPPVPDFILETGEKVWFDRYGKRVYPDSEFARFEPGYVFAPYIPMEELEIDIGNDGEQGANAGNVFDRYRMSVDTAIYGQVDLNDNEE